MPPVHSTPLQIDPQWAQTLVGLPMSVPEHWWDGCKGNTLFKCRIVGVNCRDTSERYFVFECEDDDDDYSNDEGQRFPMRYDAVYHYADSDHANYSKFNLPVIPPAAPLPNETVWVRSFQNKIIVSGSISEAVVDDATIYTMTKPEDWYIVKGKQRGRKVGPIEYTGISEQFEVNATEEEVKEMMDDNGDIRYYKVLEWSLPRFEGESPLLFDWIAAQMRNYMVHLMKTTGWKPHYYNPESDIIILGDHVARFIGVQSARMLHGFPSVEDTWSSRDPLDSVGTAKESMPRTAYQEIARCLHFTDDWEEDEHVNWNDIYVDDKFVPSDNTAHH